MNDDNIQLLSQLSTIVITEREHCAIQIESKNKETGSSKRDSKMENMEIELRGLLNEALDGKSRVPEVHVEESADDEVRGIEETPVDIQGKTPMRSEEAHNYLTPNMSDSVEVGSIISGGGSSIDITDFFKSSGYEPAKVDNDGKDRRNSAIEDELQLTNTEEKVVTIVTEIPIVTIIDTDDPGSSAQLDDIAAPDEQSPDPFAATFAEAAETSRSYLPVYEDAEITETSTDDSPQHPHPRRPKGRHYGSFRKLFRPRSSSSSSSKLSKKASRSRSRSRSPSPLESPTSAQSSQSNLFQDLDTGLPRVRRRSHVYSQRRSVSHTTAVSQNNPIDIDHLAACDSDESISCATSPFDISTVPFDPANPYLDISCRNLSHFPILPARFEGLVELHLVNNWITAVPGFVLPVLSKLQVLDMSQNLLKELPAEIRCLSELRELYVRENRLENVNSELGKCVSLEVLDLGNNKISALEPELFAQISKLKTLDLSRNKLRILPSSIGLIPSLQNLQIDDNPFDVSFKKLVTPLVAALQLEREGGIGKQSSSRPSDTTSQSEADWSRASSMLFDDSIPSTPVSATGSMRSVQRRVRSLPPEGLSTDQISRLEGLFAGHVTPNGSMRSLSSVRSRGSYPGIIFRDSMGDAEGMMQGAESGSFRFTAPRGGSKRTGLVGTFPLPGMSASSHSMDADLPLKDEEGDRGGEKGTEGVELDEGHEQSENRKKEDRQREKQAGTVGKSKGSRLFGLAGKKKPSILPPELVSPTSPTSPAAPTSPISPTSPTSPASPTTPTFPSSASLIVPDRDPIPGPIFGPRTSSLADTPAVVPTSPTKEKEKASSNRNRLSSFFASKPSSQASFSQQTADREPPSQIYLRRLLNYLRDVHDLDPRTNGVGVEVLNKHTPDTTTRKIDNVDSSQDPKLRKKQTPARRHKVVQEILTTERTYVDQLEALVEVYVKPIEEREILTAQEINGIFANVGNILMFHKEVLLPDLEKACRDTDKEGEGEQRLGGVFLKAAPFLRMYSIYYNNFDSANTLVCQMESQASTTSTTSLPTATTSTSPSQTNQQQLAQRAALKAIAKRFRDFASEAKQHPRHTQNSLQSFLILPVQRLPRYKLLVDELFECTPPEHPDYPDLKRAREEVRRRVEECNEKKREWEAREHGLAVLLRVRIRPWSSGADSVKHVRPGRRFVKEGIMRVVKCVEFVGAATGSRRIDASMACGGKKERFRQNVVGHLLETKFGVKGNKGNDESGVDGASTLTALRLAGAGGKQFRFFLFTDLLCWCKAKPGPEGEYDLVRGIDLQITSAEEEGKMGVMELVEIDDSPGEERGGKGKEAILRIRDRECIVYMRAGLEELRDWVDRMKER